MTFCSLLLFNPSIISYLLLTRVSDNKTSNSTSTKNSGTTEQLLRVQALNHKNQLEKYNWEYIFYGVMWLIRHNFMDDDLIMGKIRRKCFEIFFHELTRTAFTGFLLFFCWSLPLENFLNKFGLWWIVKGSYI